MLVGQTTELKPKIQKLFPFWSICHLVYLGKHKSKYLMIKVNYYHTKFQTLPSKVLCMNKP